MRSSNGTTLSTDELNGTHSGSAVVGLWVMPDEQSWDEGEWHHELLRTDSMTCSKLCNTIRVGASSTSDCRWVKMGPKGMVRESYKRDGVQMRTLMVLSDDALKKRLLSTATASARTPDLWPLRVFTRRPSEACQTLRQRTMKFLCYTSMHAASTLGVLPNLIEY